MPLAALASGRRTASQQRLLGVLDWSSNRECKCGATFGSGASKTHWEVRALPVPRPRAIMPASLPLPRAAMRARCPAFRHTPLPAHCKRYGFTGTREARDAGTRPRCRTRTAASMQARPRLYRARPWPRKRSSCHHPYSGQTGLPSLMRTLGSLKVECLYSDWFHEHKTRAMNTALHTCFDATRGTLYAPPLASVNQSRTSIWLHRQLTGRTLVHTF